MRALEGRIAALERARKKPLPEYTLTLEDGSKVHLDALEAVLYAAQLEAGKKGVQRVTYLTCTRGELPATGTIWADLEKDLMKRPGSN